MQPIEFKTPAGYTIIIKPDLSYGEFLTIQEILTSNVSINPEKNSISDIPASVLFESNRKAIEFLVQKIIKPDGTELENPKVEIFNLPRSEVQTITSKVNEITASASISEKKGGV